jgi:hypothetical protein
MPDGATDQIRDLDAFVARVIATSYARHVIRKTEIGHV